MSIAAVKWPQATEGNCCVTYLCDSLTGGVGQGGRLGGGGEAVVGRQTGRCGGGGVRGAMGDGGRVQWGRRDECQNIYNKSMSLA